MTIANLIRNCSFEQVNEKILLHYGNKDNEKFRQLFNQLKKKSALPIKADSLTILIKVYHETEDDSIYVAEFDEDDVTLYYDVSGFMEDEEMLYSIASSGYDEFLTYEVAEETLKNFSPESIIAHCLYEITAYGFEKPV